MKKFLKLGLLTIVLLSACASPSTNTEVIEEGQSPLVTVYKPPT
jgi:hypothetical protein